MLLFSHIVASPITDEVLSATSPPTA